MMDEFQARGAVSRLSSENRDLKADRSLLRTKLAQSEENLAGVLQLLKEIAIAYRNGGEGKFSEMGRMQGLIHDAELITRDTPRRTR